MSYTQPYLALLYLLLSGFLASRLPPAADVQLFSHAARKPGRKGGGARKMKLADVPTPLD